MDSQFWRIFAIGFLVINTLCVVVLFEMIFLGKPYISAFFILFFCLYRLNKKLLSRSK